MAGDRSGSSARPGRHALSFNRIERGEDLRRQLGEEGQGVLVEVVESINPANVCVAGDSALEISTWHDRLSGSGNAWYDITVRGSATASLNGLSFSMAAPVYVETY